MRQRDRAWRCACVVAAMVCALGAMAKPAQARGGVVPADEPSKPMVDAMFEQADALFEQGLEVAGDDEAHARDLFHQAAVLYASITQRGVVNPRVLVNAGNAFMLAGETGQAVVHYRRAQRLSPTDPVVARALANARSRVGMVVKPSTGARLAQAALSWRGVLPRSVLLGLFIAGYLALWAIAFVRLMRGPGRAGGRIAVIAGSVCVVTLALIWVDHAQMVRTDTAVIVAPQGVVARNGPSAGVYEATFDQPLAQGVEVRVLETRDGWARVRLIDSHETWVPIDSIERV